MAEPQGDEGRAGSGSAGLNAYSLGRLLTFSDGVFAIAITILVLNLVVPDLHNATPDRLRAALLNDATGLLGFGLSFYVIGSLWSFHHRLLCRVQRLTAPLRWLNLLMLAPVCLIPFTTGVPVRYGTMGIGVQPYALNVALANLVGVAIYIHICARQRPAGSRRTLVRALIGPAVFLASMPVAEWQPLYAELAWLLLLPVLHLLPNSPEGSSP